MEKPPEARSHRTVGPGEELLFHSKCRKKLWSSVATKITFCFFHVNSVVYSPKLAPGSFIATLGKAYSLVSATLNSKYI